MNFGLHVPITKLYTINVNKTRETCTFKMFAVISMGAKMYIITYMEYNHCYFGSIIQN